MRVMNKLLIFCGFFNYVLSNKEEQKPNINNILLNRIENQADLENQINTFFNFLALLFESSLEIEGDFALLNINAIKKLLELRNFYMNFEYFSQVVLSRNKQYEKKKQIEYEILKLKKNNPSIFRLFKNFNENINMFIDINMFLDYLDNINVEMPNLLITNNFYEDNNKDFINNEIILNKYKNIIEILDYIVTILHKNNIDENNNKDLFDFIKSENHANIKKLEEINIKKNNIITKIKYLIVSNKEIKEAFNKLENNILDKKILKLSYEINKDYNNFNIENKKYIDNINSEINNINIFDILNPPEALINDNNINENNNTINNFVKNIFNIFLNNLNNYTENIQEKFNKLNLKKKHHLMELNALLNYINEKKQWPKYLNYIKNYEKINKCLTIENKKNVLYKISKKKTIFKYNQHNKYNQHDKYNQFLKIIKNLNEQKNSIKENLNNEYNHIINTIENNKHIDL